MDWSIIKHNHKSSDVEQVVVLMRIFQCFLQSYQEVKDVLISVLPKAKLRVDYSLISKRRDRCWRMLNLMNVNHGIVWTKPRSVLETSGIERCFINPDEPRLDLDQCLEEGFEDYSVEYDIVSVRLDHSQLWLTIPVLQIVSEYLLQLDRGEELEVFWVLHKDCFANAL